MTSLHPRGVNHLALSTCDMLGQLEFWCDVLGLPLKALYWMHGVENTFHGFVELASDSYVAFVQHPENPATVELGVTHAGNPGGPVAAGAMQHVAFDVASLDEVLAMRDRIRSRGVQVMGPIDHGMIQSIYFAGPEGLSLEVCCGSNIDAEAWIDPEVVGLCGIDDAALAAFKAPAAYERPAEPVDQPPGDTGAPRMRYPDPAAVDRIMAVSDDDIWTHVSEATPPVAGG